MRSYVTSIERDTLSNEDYRRVLFTGPYIQLVLMTLRPGEQIGLEVHAGHDQFIRVEAGTGYVQLDGQRHELSDGSAVVIASGTEHNVVNNLGDGDAAAVHALQSTRASRRHSASYEGR